MSGIACYLSFSNFTNSQAVCIKILTKMFLKSKGLFCFRQFLQQAQENSSENRLLLSPKLLS
jgi:hypothetical protein